MISAGIFLSIQGVLYLTKTSHELSKFGKKGICISAGIFLSIQGILYITKTAHELSKSSPTNISIWHTGKRDSPFWGNVFKKLPKASPNKLFSVKIWRQPSEKQAKKKQILGIFVPFSFGFNQFVHSAFVMNSCSKKGIKETALKSIFHCLTFFLSLEVSN